MLPQILIIHGPCEAPQIPTFIGVGKTTACQMFFYRFFLRLPSFTGDFRKFPNITHFFLLETPAKILFYHFGGERQIFPPPTCFIRFSLTPIPPSPRHFPSDSFHKKKGDSVVFADYRQPKPHSPAPGAGLPVPHSLKSPREASMASHLAPSPPRAVLHSRPHRRVGSLQAPGLYGLPTLGLR